MYKIAVGYILLDSSPDGSECLPWCFLGVKLHAEDWLGFVLICFYGAALTAACDSEAVRKPLDVPRMISKRYEARAQAFEEPTRAIALDLDPSYFFLIMTLEVS